MYTYHTFSYFNWIKRNWTISACLSHRWNSRNYTVFLWSEYNYFTSIYLFPLRSARRLIHSDPPTRVHLSDVKCPSTKSSNSQCSGSPLQRTQRNELQRSRLSVGSLMVPRHQTGMKGSLMQVLQFLSETIVSQVGCVSVHLVSFSLSLLSVNQPHRARQPFPEPWERVPVGLCAAEKWPWSCWTSWPCNFPHSPGLRPHGHAG